MKTRKCLNPECPNPANEIKRSNMLYCSISCKNEHNYRENKVLYKYEITMQRHRKNIIKLLEYWWNKGLRELGIVEATNSGFYFPSCYISTKDKNGFETYRFNDFEIYIDHTKTIHLSKLAENDLKTF